MEIYVECDCGKELSIISTTSHGVDVRITVECCDNCAKDNYEAGEDDAKQERL